LCSWLAAVLVSHSNAKAKLPGPPTRSLKLEKTRMAAPVSFNRLAATFALREKLQRIFAIARYAPLYI
jgi:hypothetical protein